MWFVMEVLSLGVEEEVGLWDVEKAMLVNHVFAVFLFPAILLYRLIYKIKNKEK